MDGILVINLDTSRERMDKFLQDNAETLPLDKVHRLSAVLGRSLPSFGKEPWFTERTAERASYWGGAGGCTLSHAKAIAMAKEKGWRNVLIMEDDVLTGQHPDALAMLEYALKNAEGDYMLYLGYSRPTDEACDGYVARERGVAIGIRTADCVPILMAAVDEQGEPYAVGAAHAGWRGTIAGIATECVRRMTALGARVEHIRVAIGPCIRSCCFEIDDAARDLFVRRLGEAMTDRFVCPTWAGHYDADLVGINLALLADVGVDGERVAVSTLCTRCRNDLFWSHRRDGRARGSMLSVICLPK